MIPCTKRGYQTKADAKRSIKTGRAMGKNLRAYRCQLCRKWHLTSTPPRKAA